MDGIEFRMLGRQDAAILAAVADVFDNPVDPARAEAFLAADGHMMAVARADAVVVGMASGVLLQHPDKIPALFISEVGVDPAWRRRGIATVLIGMLKDSARTAGCVEAWLGTEVDNVAARAVYQRLDPKEEEAFVMYAWALD